MSKSRRRIIRACIDFSALLGAWGAMRLAGASDIQALLASAFVSIYGLFCFWDGVLVGEKHIANGESA